MLTNSLFNGRGGLADTLKNLPVNQFLMIDEGETIVSVSDENSTSLFPNRPELLQNYPNPFNPSTTIRYEVAARTVVSLRIFNLAGQFIAELVSEDQNPGVYSITWNGVDLNGNAVSSGIYFYRLENGTFGFTRKMLLLR